MEKPTVVAEDDLLMKADNMKAKPVLNKKEKLLYASEKSPNSQNANPNWTSKRCNVNGKKLGDSHHIEFKQEEQKEQDCETVIQEKTKLKHHSKENYEKGW